MPSRRVVCRMSWPLFIVAAFVACATPPRARTLPVAVGYEESGLASWYGHPFHGRRTASGEVYDMRRMTAAHRTMPFGTWVRVTNLDTGRSVEVRINDRGPFAKGRIIDVSYAAARVLGAVGPGVIPVRLRVIAPSGASPAELRFAEDRVDLSE